MELIIPAALTGAIGSVLTELFKFIPALSKSSLRKAITAVVITTLTVLGYTLVAAHEPFTLELVVLSLIFSLGTYKTIVEPVTETR
jgi:uncharacterized membrane protein